MMQQIAVIGRQDAKNNLPSMRAFQDHHANSITTPSVGVRREVRPWCLTWC
jgi:hypothetical protein